MSKTPYRVSTLEMIELKVQLQELLEKRYVKKSVSPCRAPFLIVKGIMKVILVRQVSAMQLKKFCRKGCQLYAAHILEPTGDETPRLEDY